MKIRGQNNEAWLARWRDGACPVHGGGLVDDSAAVPTEGSTTVRCSVDECDVRAARWPVEDAHHAQFGWRAGPAEVHALLAKAGDIDLEGDKPGKRARIVRTSYALE